jgi:hypothetical protein
MEVKEWPFSNATAAGTKKTPGANLRNARGAERRNPSKKPRRRIEHFPAGQS